MRKFQIGKARGLIPRGFVRDPALKYRDVLDEIRREITAARAQLPQNLGALRMLRQRQSGAARKRFARVGIT